MKKYILLLFLFASMQVKGQLGFQVEFSPEEPVLSSDQFMLEANYLFGEGAIRYGALVQTDHSFDFFILGAKSECLITKPSDATEFNFLVAWGYDIEETQENQFSDPHNRHYVQGGFSYSLNFLDRHTFKIAASKRYWGDLDSFVLSVGSTFRLGD